MRTLPFLRADLDLPTSAGAMPVRSSISGVQDKVLLACRRGRFSVVSSGGEYILKPVPSTPLPRFQSDVPANEDLTMDIAARVFGIRTAEHELVAFADGELAYMTRRFDSRDGVRIPQEDFCQLSGRTADTAGTNYKYDSSYEECGEIVRRVCPSFRVELPKLFRRILFSYVFSNGDAHLKNFSVQASRQGDPILTPAYDLVATSIHVPTETPLALDLLAGGRYTPEFEARGFYSGADFLALGATYGLAESWVRRQVGCYSGSVGAVHSLIDGSRLSAPAKDAYRAAFADRLRAVTQF